MIPAPYQKLFPVMRFLVTYMAYYFQAISFGYIPSRIFVH